MADAVAAFGIQPVVTDTIMRGPREKASLARVALETGGWQAGADAASPEALLSSEGGGARVGL
jgi:hypothetical protein